MPSIFFFNINLFSFFHSLKLKLEKTQKEAELQRLCAAQTRLKELLATAKLHNLTNTGVLREAINESFTIEQNLYRNCGYPFSDRELSVLRNIPPEQSKDYAFISQIVRFMYKGREESLKNKTIYGKGSEIRFMENGDIVKIPKKDALTPSNYKALAAAFEERTQYVTGNELFESTKRFKTLNRHLGKSMYQMSKD